MVIAALALVTATLPIVRVGDPAMNGSRLVPYDNVWLVTLHYADGRVVERGLSTDHVRFVSFQGKRRLSRIESEADVVSLPGQAPVSATSSTFNIFDPVTMAPLHGEARSSDGDSMVREFDGRTIITRTREPGAAEQTATTTTAEPPFDFHGGMTGLLLATLPLKAGYRVRIPGMGDTDLDYTEIRVVGRERVKAGRLGRIATWRVDIGPDPAASSYWISKLPPYVIKAVVRGPKGYASWDMVD